MDDFNKLGEACGDRLSNDGNHATILKVRSNYNSLADLLGGCTSSDNSKIGFVVAAKAAAEQLLADTSNNILSKHADATQTTMVEVFKVTGQTYRTTRMAWRDDMKSDSWEAMRALGAKTLMKIDGDKVKDLHVQIRRQMIEFKTDVERHSGGEEFQQKLQGVEALVKDCLVLIKEATILFLFDSFNGEPVKLRKVLLAEKKEPSGNYKTLGNTLGMPPRFGINRFCERLSFNCKLGPSTTTMQGHSAHN